MEEQGEPAAETKTGAHWICAYWAGAILLLYVLSVGPVARMVQKGVLPRDSRCLASLYSPLDWAYRNTPLHKLLGMYCHVWCPQGFDKNGEMTGL